jgi:glycogen synthase kinase 3 beta
MILGRPLFPGESGVDQLVEIIKVLGTPTAEQIRSMNRHYTDFKFPSIKAKSWEDVFKKAPREVSKDAIAFLDLMLRYEPEFRTKALRALLHPWFDELRDPKTTLEDGKPLPPLFNFTDVEFCSDKTLDWKKLIPEFARNDSNWPPKTKITSTKRSSKTTSTTSSSKNSSSSSMKSSSSSSSSSKKS